MNSHQLETVQRKFKTLRGLIEGLGGDGTHRRLNGGGWKRVLEILGEIEEVWPENIVKSPGKTDEEVVKCAEALYAGAKKGFFTRNESIECLNDSIEALKGLLQRINRTKRKAEDTKKASRQYLKTIKRGIPSFPWIEPSKN